MKHKIKVPTSKRIAASRKSWRTRKRMEEARKEEQSRPDYSRILPCPHYGSDDDEMWRRNFG